MQFRVCITTHRTHIVIIVCKKSEMTSNTKYEVKTSEQLGRYLVAAKDLKPGENIISEEPFVVGPHGDSALVCFNCHSPLISKFLCCKGCAIAPICSGDGCPTELRKWHNPIECEFFAKLKLKGFGPMTMVQNVGSLVVLRAVLKKQSDAEAWEELMKLENHVNKRRNTDIWAYCNNTVTFIKSLGLLEEDGDKELIQKICGAIDVNSFEARGPSIPGLGYSETLRGSYMKAALLAHDCVANTHLSINDNYVLIISASTKINKGETIYYNYTDPLQGTEYRQKHLMIGKYFQCTCRRCSDCTELGTFLSAAKCPSCKTGYMNRIDAKWLCQDCMEECKDMDFKLKCCADKLDVINKKDEKELEEYIRNVSVVLAPNHYLLLDAKQKLAGVLRDTINREPHPTNKLIRRKIELCKELLPVLENLIPGISRTKAITLYELHSAMVQLSKKLFDAREINGPTYLDQLLAAEKLLKRSLEMLFIEPGNSPEGELCAKALEEYRALKSTMGLVLDGIHAEGKTYVCNTDNEHNMVQ